jgi:sulfate permease, SulP family
MMKNIARECLAGCTVAIVALPLAIAFGIAATGTSEGALVGLYGAIFAGLFAALFGGTPGQVSGPTGPITVIATGVIATYGLEASFFAFIMAGIFQLLFGIIRIGSYVRYIPFSVVSGFMNGIALIIILGEVEHVTESFLVVLFTICIMLLSSKWIKAIPASLIALVGVTVLLPFIKPVLEHLTVYIPVFGEVTLNNTIQTIGAIPEAWPTLHIPTIDMPLILELMIPALSIALLGSIDSLLTSVVMDSVTGKRHKSNKELIGQGIGNIMSGLFGGLAGAGATVRSIVNVKSGGRTALSACMHSVILFILVVGLGNVVQYIPFAVLAGILILTGIGMFDWPSLRKIHVMPKGDVFVMILTMVITVLVDLIIAVGVGIVIAALLYFVGCKKRNAVIEEEKPATYRIEGPLSFLSVEKIFSTIQLKEDESTLKMNDVHYIDLSGAVALLNFIEQANRQGKKVRLADMNASVQEVLVKIANEHQQKMLSFVEYSK